MDIDCFLILSSPQHRKYGNNAFHHILATSPCLFLRNPPDKLCSLIRAQSEMDHIVYDLSLLISLALMLERLLLNLHEWFQPILLSLDINMAP